MKKLLFFVLTILLLNTIVNATQLAGSYTINAAAPATTNNFQNVLSAIRFLNGGSRTDAGPNNASPFGVSGPVIFNLSPGNYPENITVNATTGASLTNTITIQKLPASVGEVVFNTSVSTGLSIFNMSSQTGRYYVLKNLRFQPTVTTIGGGISSIINNAYFLTVDNCIFDHANIATNNIFDFYLSSEVLVTNSTFFNSLSTAKYQGGVFSNSFYMSFNNNIVKNTAFNVIYLRTATFNTFQQCGITVTPTQEVFISSFNDNILNNATINVASMYTNSTFNIERNKINIDRQNFPDVYTTATDAIGHGISFTPFGASPAVLRIVNNFISINQNTLPVGTSGIYTSGNLQYSAFIYHNTASVNSTQQTVYPLSGTGGLVKNNIFSSSGGGVAAIEVSELTRAYNNYYSTAIPAYVGIDLNATTEKIFFTSTTDLHHNNGCLKGLALGITTDIDGSSKNATTPVRGATEASPAGTDAAVSKTIMPDIVYTQGPSMQTINFKLVNKGAITITAAQANYTVNNGTPVIETFSGLNIAPCDSVTLSFTGQYNFAAGRSILNIALTQTNGAADFNTSNDNVQANVDILGPMNGIYTVNPAAASTQFNFQRIGEADSALMARTVSGPVTIQIYNGTYNENKAILGAVTGLSATNPITFTSFSNDSLQVNIDSLRFKDVSYITVKKLKIFTLSFDSSASNCTIINNNLSKITWNAGSNVDIRNNYVNGIIINKRGGLAGAQINNINISNNIFANGTATELGFAYLIKYFGVNKPVFNNNTVRDFNAVQTGSCGASCSYEYGGVFDCRNCTDSIIITNNRFERVTTKRLVSNTQGNNQVGNGVGFLTNAYVANNFFSYQAAQGLTFSTGVPTVFIFNNVHNISSAATCIVTNDVTDCRNNIFASKNNTPAVAFSNLPSATINFNNYFTNSATLILANIGGGSFATLASWQAASGKDANSKNVNPKYIDSVNLHIQHPTLLGAGTPAPTINPILFDIDNDNRNSLNPAIGADEPMLLSNDVIAKQLFAVKKEFAANAPQPLSIRITNNGAAALNQVKVRWSIDGTEQLPPYNWTGNLAYDSSTTINFGNYSFPMLKYSSLKVWTDLPNAAPDEAPINDTLRLDSIMPFARGQFTIGGVNPSLPSFTKAGEFLNYGGVDGAVNILLRNGKYIEQPTIRFIKGASLTNLVTFKGENNNASLDTLAFTATGIGSNPFAVLALDSAAFVNFKHITFQSTNPGNGYVTEILLRNKVRFINIDSCAFHSISAASSSAYAHILQQPSSIIDSNINITNSRFNSGVGGVIMTIRNGIIKRNRFEAMGSGSQAIDVSVSANSFALIDSNFVQNPIICTFQSGNNCFAFGTNSIGGIKLNFATGTNVDVTVSRNKIYASGGVAFYSQSNGTALKPIKVYNNFFSGKGRTVYAGGQYHDFFNNTIADSSSNSNNSLVDVANSNINFKNNILAKTVTTPDLFYRLLDINNSFYVSTFSSNNNAYYIADSTKTIYNGTTNLTLSAWKALGKDANSKKITPAFVSYYSDLHIDKNKAGAVDVFKFGAPLSAIPKDIDDSIRNPIAPSIGADEFTLNDDDGGALAITNLGIPVAQGTNNIIASIRNYGNNNITAATINWSVNNAIQTPYSWTGNIATGDSAVNLNIGNFNFTGIGKYDIKVWTSIAGDINAVNDTAYKTVYPALCGNYTIAGTTPDFISFSAASKYASFAGVSCPVVFNIRDGVYNESDTINFIPGTSAINTVTFQSQSLDSSKVQYTQSASFIGANTVAVLTLNTVQHVKFKAIGFKRVADPLYNFYFDVIGTNGNVSGLDFTSCEVSSSGPGKLINVPFYSFQTIPNTDLVFNKNNFTGGATGINIGFQNNTIYSRAVTITNNKFNKTIGSGSNTFTIDLGGVAIANISNNYIDSCTSNRYIGGIRLVYVSGKTNVLGNTIIKRKATYGIYLEGVSGGSVTDSAVVVGNNFITIDSTLSPVGIYGTQVGRNVKIVYNNILNNSTSSSSRALQFAYSYNAGTLKDTIANNNMVSTAAGISFAVFQNTAADIQCNNNNIFATGSAILTNYNSTNYTTIPTFQTAGGTFANNVSKNPLYISATDLHVLELSLRTNGTPLNYVLKDIDNDTRGLVNTTIGADEIVVSNLDMGVSALVTPTKPFAAGTQNITVALKNYGATSITNTTVNWSINGTLQTPFNFTGSIAFGNTVNATIASYNFVVDSAYNLKFWTSNPNGSADNNLTNDSTIIADFYPALSGTYTLGGTSPNFKGFGRSMRNLKYGGVLGNVIFNAREAVYYDNLLVDSIPFQNNFSVTWQGETADSTKAYLYHKTVNGDNVKAVVLFSNAKNIVVKNITIAGKTIGGFGPMYSVIQFLSKNKNIQITGNRIIDSTYDPDPQNTNNVGLSLISNIDREAGNNNNYPASKDSGTIINGNRLVQYNNTTFSTAVEIRGGYTLDFQGVPQVSHFLNNSTFSNNIFDLKIANKRGFESRYNDSLKLIGNKIMGSVTADGKDLIIVDKNDVYHEGYSSVAVTVNAGTGRVAGKPVIISNNMIQTKVVGFYNGDYVNNAGLIVTGDRANIIHNTLMATDTGYGSSGYTQAVLFELNGSRDTVKNNIFFNSNGGYLLRYTGVTNLISNNNNYFYTNHFSPASTSLTQHKILFAQDANSVENINPYFRGVKDLHASNILLKVAPTVTPSNIIYTTDFDGQTRTGTVSFGADEFTQPANDLVITEMQPAKIFAEGLNDIKIRVYNNGSNAITSFNTIVKLTNYPGNVSGGNYNPVNAGNLNYTFSGNIAPGASQLITLGQLNIPLYRNQIKINCSNTNGVVDDVPYTDSIQNDQFYAGLNGTYTFNNSYPTATPGVAINSFADVSLQLKLGGVYGPSTLNLKAGMHVGELRMDSIINRGAISPLVIKSEDNDSNNTGITNGGNAYPSAITIFRGSYTTVKKLNLKNTLYNAMLLGFSSQYINVENCRLKGSDALRAISGSPIVGYGIFASGNWFGITNYNDSNYTFKNNYFDGSGSALAVSGNGLGNMKNVVIDSNTFINTLGDAINLLQVKNSFTTNNIIETNTTVTNFRGIFCGSAGGTSLIKNNKIYAENDGSGVSMDDFYGYPYALTDSVKIFNNFISVGGTNAVTIGMDLVFKYKQVKIYHNSIYNRCTSAASIAFTISEGTSQNLRFDVINNIFHNKYSGIPVSIIRTNSSFPTYQNQHHNQLFTNGSLYGSIGLYNPSTLSTTTTNYPTLAALAATGIDYSSVSGDPLFVSDKDLHVDGSNVNNLGDYTVNAQVPKDIDNDVRSLSNPDIGADEFTLPDYGIVQLESPQSSCSHTTTETVKVYVKNFGATRRNKIPVAYRINGGTIVRDTANILLNAGDSALFTFAQTANLSSPINYNFEIWSDYRGDNLRSNDTLQILVATTAANNMLPYYTGFEGTQAGWYTGGQNSSFKWGVIFSGIIDSAANGLNAWKTNLTGPHKNNELSYFYSPCFDMTAVSGDPVLNFNFSHQLENNNDKAWVEMSSDAGATWSKLGAQGEGLKWYNNSGNYWTGLDNRWHNVKHLLPITALGDKSKVRIRFVLQTNGTVVQDGIAIDDISIYTGANPPVSMGTYTNRTAVSAGTGTFIPINDPSGNRLVEINDAGQTLGNITVDVNQTIGGVPTSYNGQNYLGRSFVIHVQNQPTAPVTVRLFITQAEVDAWKVLDPTIDIMRNISVQKYSSNVLEDFDITNNTNGTTLNISPARLTKLPYQDGYIIEFMVSNFSEFWLIKGTPPAPSCLGNGITFTAATSGSTYQWQVNSGSGFSNITDNANYTGTGTATLQINNVPTSTTGYRYRCMVDAVAGIENILRFVLTWTGATNTNWSLPGNWSCSTVPDEFTDVIIPTWLTNYPTINASTSVRKIDLQTGTSINVNTGITVNIKGK